MGINGPPASQGWVSTSVITEEGSQHPWGTLAGSISVSMQNATRVLGKTGIWGTNELWGK